MDFKEERGILSMGESAGRTAEQENIMDIQYMRYPIIASTCVTLSFFYKAQLETWFIPH